MALIKPALGGAAGLETERTVDNTSGTWFSNQRTSDILPRLSFLTSRISSPRLFSTMISPTGDGDRSRMRSTLMSSLSSRS